MNDSVKYANCVPKVVSGDTRIAVCFFAVADINIDQEIRYNYGPGDFEWRKEVCVFIVNNSLATTMLAPSILYNIYTVPVYLQQVCPALVQHYMCDRRCFYTFY